MKFCETHWQQVGAALSERELPYTYEELPVEIPVIHNAPKHDLFQSACMVLGRMAVDQTGVGGIEFEGCPVCALQAVDHIEMVANGAAMHHAKET